MLHKPAIERIESASDIGEHLLEIFQGLAEDAEENDHVEAALTAHFIKDGDEFEVGTYVPTLVFMLQKVLPDDPTP
jgi:hypothetical protein